MNLPSSPSQIAVELLHFFGDKYVLLSVKHFVLYGTPSSFDPPPIFPSLPNFVYGELLFSLVMSDHHKGLHLTSPPKARCSAWFGTSDRGTSPPSVSLFPSSMALVTGLSELRLPGFRGCYQMLFLLLLPVTELDSSRRVDYFLMFFFSSRKLRACTPHFFDLWDVFSVSDESYDFFLVRYPPSR